MDKNKKKVLIITRNLPPLVGGMERLNWHMADELSKYAQVTVVAPKGSKTVKPKNVDLVEVPLRPLLFFLIFVFLKGAYLSLKIKPDTFLAGSGLTAPLAWLLARLVGAKAVAYLHGFDITVNHCAYRLLWRPVFKKLDIVIVNSTPTKTLAIESGVKELNLGLVYPGVNIPKSEQPQTVLDSFREQHGLMGKKILISVGRLTTRKGLREFVEMALPSIVQAVPDAMLVVVGEAPKDSLGASIQSVDSIKEAAKRHGIENHLLFLGVITDPQKLATVYEMADMHVFPVRHIPNDPEGFGMVAVEAAAHGTPTVAFATGGVVDAVKQGESGWLVKSGDYRQLAEKIVCGLSEQLKEEGIISFAKRFEWGAFGGKLNAILFGDAD